MEQLARMLSGNLGKSGLSGMVTLKTGGSAADLSEAMRSIESKCGPAGVVYASSDTFLKLAEDEGTGNDEVSLATRQKTELKLLQLNSHLAEIVAPQPGQWFTMDYPRYRFPECGSHAFYVQDLPAERFPTKKPMSIGNCIIAVPAPSVSGDHVLFAMPNNTHFRAVREEVAVPALLKTDTNARALINFAQDGVHAFQRAADVPVGQLVRPRKGTVAGTSHHAVMVVKIFEDEKIPAIKERNTTCVNFGKNVLVRMINASGNQIEFSTHHSLLCPMERSVTPEQVQAYCDKKADQKARRESRLQSLVERREENRKIYDRVGASKRAANLYKGGGNDGDDNEGDGEAPM